MSSSILAWPRLLPTGGGACSLPPFAGVQTRPRHRQVGEVEVLGGVVLGPPDLPRWQHRLVHRFVREGRRVVSHWAVGRPGGGGGAVKRGGEQRELQPISVGQQVKMWADLEISLSGSISSCVTVLPLFLPLLLLAWPGEGEVSSLSRSREVSSLPRSEVSEMRESALMDRLLLSPLRGSMSPDISDSLSAMYLIYRFFLGPPEFSKYKIPCKLAQNLSKCQTYKRILYQENLGGSRKNPPCS